MTHPFLDTITRELETTNLGRSVSAARVLLVVTCAEEARIVELDATRPLTLGRREPADIVLSAPNLSRVHARFRLEEDAVLITDLGSRNGTFVRGERITETTLQPGDTAVLGSVTVSLQVTAPPAVAIFDLFSRAAILRKLDEEWIRARSFHRPFTVVQLRPLNTATFRPSKVAAKIVHQLRPADRAGLLDARSILLVLPELDAHDAEALMRMLLEHTTDVQMACGIASYPESGANPCQLLSASSDAARQANDAAPIGRAPALAHVRDPLGSDAAIYKSPQMLELVRIVERVALGSIPVLIVGETGTGKELIARALHDRSLRRRAPLKVVNCAAIPSNLIESILFGHCKGAFTGADRDRPGVFEQAKGGTVFFDEVGELSPSAQAALLRVLEDKRFSPVGSAKELEADVRIVAATHRDLLGMTQQGTFRLDLYHRLNVLLLELPPLRERKEEIQPLAEHFVDRYAQANGQATPRISPEAANLLLDYAWPGNVRELKNVLERALALAEGDVIHATDLPMSIHDLGRLAPETASDAGDVVKPNGTTTLKAEVREREARLIREALKQTGGHRREAAQLLGVPLRTFERKLARLLHEAKPASDAGASD